MCVVPCASHVPGWERIRHYHISNPLSFCVLPLIGINANLQNRHTSACQNSINLAIAAHYPVSMLKTYRSGQWSSVAYTQEMQISKTQEIANFRQSLSLLGLCERKWCQFVQVKWGKNCLKFWKKLYGVCVVKLNILLNIMGTVWKQYLSSFSSKSSW